ncbi:ribosomal protein S18-alanine N-acetyltransferase [Methylonatrum kenyense]|uniref:ribosomal protein S18-alanine N-acetyltransferase n=1 Tax=Methylonatrum kenyense TaxID=455253 RepID=UPI00202B1286|nr:ribosomal protein S18-alanine N-acetyltransferase [Methylonatrum kenyense]MCK8516099.1 ribosomal protein S18-alanine N-acetyltransferase [Methylonatrum kenyense]
MSAVSREPDMIDVRLMTDSDLAAVLRIEQESYGFPWSESIFRDCLGAGYACWVAERDARLRGFLIMSTAAGEAHILNLCVGADVRRSGVGRRLLVHALSVAVRCGVDSLFLEVRPSNVAAVRLYTENGFHEVGLRPGYYPLPGGRREDGLIMARTLRQPGSESRGHRGS